MVIYKGKEPCIGCGALANIKPRSSKNSLCGTCTDELSIGRDAKHQAQIEHQSVFQHYYAYHGDVLNKIVHMLLSSVHNPYATNKGVVSSLRHTFGSNGEWYSIPETAFGPFKDIMDILSKLNEDIMAREEQIPIDIREQISSERNKIYNAGIERGRNLLLQLNNCEITPNDFASTKKYPNEEGG